MIIGLGYQARVGKDEVARFLVEDHGFQRIGFADALKEACRVIYGFDDEQLYGDRKEEPDEFWGETPRHVLQVFGTECVRNGHRDDVWIKAVERAVSRGGDWVIPDVRFPNEAEAIREWGGRLVHVVRPCTPGIPTVGHASETAMAGYRGWTYRIVNKRSLEDLRRETRRMVGFLQDSGLWVSDAP